MGYIELMDISKSYNKQSNVLNGIDLNIEKGEFFVLVGPSGSGKSTLLRMIAGLEEISGGTLKINDKLVNHLPPKDRDLSMVFQNYALYPHLTVEQNILFGLNARKVDKQEQKKRLDETAQLMGLSELLQRKPRELSGGQRQRVALARAVVSEAPLCLMDEPLSNLDAKLRANMRIEIRRLQKRLGLTMVYVTHDQVEAMTMGDRIMVLNDGIIQQVGEPITLYNKPSNLFVATFIGSPKMNLGKAVIMDDHLFVEDVIKLPIHSNQVKSTIKNAIIGIRAEHMPRGVKGDQTIEVEVVNIEQLGNETLVSFEVGAELWTAKWLGQWLGKIGDKVSIHMSIEHMHFFDSRTGDLIQAASETNKQEVVKI